ncbi:MAG TPA: HAMP domain-containing sensor histidine kinase [Bacteroidia bacterium]|nr:HAMP domain-containing sensor histidine kinase [Bacteroidia bacterium]
MKLLQRATVYYAGVFLALMVVFTGLFYTIIQFFFLRSLDKSLLKEKEKISYSLSSNLLPEQVMFDADEEVEYSIVPLSTVVPDQYHTIYYADEWKQNGGHEVESEPHRELVTFLIQNDKVYRITIRKSMIESEDLLYSILMIEIVTLLVLMGSFLLVNVWISKKLWNSFYDSLNKLKTFQLSGANSLDFESSSIFEFEELNKVLKSMSDRVQKDYALQKQFTENASHELQTPLMIIRSRVELLLQEPDLKEVQVKLLESIDNACQKLSHINRALLLLAKIENNQFIKSESILLSELIEGIAKNLSDRIQLKSLTLHMNLMENVTLNMDPTLADILVSNLLQNCIRHNYNGGTISIELKERYLNFSNSGEAPEIDPNQVFHRFKKSQKREEGTGLGLAIVKQICDNSGLTIKYDYQDTIHSIIITW